MNDRFFTQEHCDRCKKDLNGVRTMSMYNEQCICMSCKKEETEKKDYKAAVKADHEQIKKGNYNYKGIGLK